MQQVDPNFKDMWCALLDAGAEFLLIGGHALGVHGVPRYTRDIDFWVRPTPENAERVWHALAHFGAPMAMFSREDLSRPNMVFQIGVPPLRIDLVTSIAGVSFEQAWANRTDFPFDGRQIPVIGIDDLIHNKLAAGRDRDLSDVRSLKKLHKRQ